jgi:hypothetical protein
LVLLNLLLLPNIALLLLLLKVLLRLRLCDSACVLLLLLLLVPFGAPLPSSCCHRCCGAA